MTVQLECYRVMLVPIDMIDIRVPASAFHT
jgi:hypothetical protein